MITFMSFNQGLGAGNFSPLPAKTVEIRIMGPHNQGKIRRNDLMVALEIKNVIFLT